MTAGTGGTTPGGAPTHVEIRRAERLSFRERQVVVLKESGLGNEAIARRLRVSPSTVATLYNRARAKGYEVVIVLPEEALGIPPEEDVNGDGTDGGHGQRTGGQG
ncbi:MAG TPA: sigma-70 family RNA polymerase sigma factor [Firmicutes bacterium]|nr:sigma-70 family RNA polymerase sigma factor [Bacillota bacterium]